MRLRAAFILLVLPLVAAGCTHQPESAAPPAVAPTLAGDPAHPGHTAGWVDTKLYFGLGPADEAGKGISESAWRGLCTRQGSHSALP